MNIAGASGARQIERSLGAGAVGAIGQGDAAAVEGGEPFQLQGSYRDMARLTGRLHPSLTPADVDALITDHYRAESHVLASGAGTALHHLATLRAALA